MKTSASEKATVELTKSETDHVAGGAPEGSPGNFYGEGRGFGNPTNLHGNNGNGQGVEHKNEHGRFPLL
jgi:hypothetical protein